MKFKSSDGREIRVIEGFRERVLSYRKSVSPRGNWEDADYGWAAEKRLKRARRLIEKLTAGFGPMENTEILEIGCGDGFNTAMFALHGAKQAVGIDLDLRRDKRDERGEAVRRLLNEVVRKMAVADDFDSWTERLPTRYSIMNATETDFPSDGFDLVISRSVLEHIHPIEKLFTEMARIVRPGGMVYHEIDPFFWIRGCHKRGIVDIPWAHARLSLEDYHRFVAENEGRKMADKRLDRLTTLNRLTLKQWKDVADTGPFEMASWTESTSPFAEEVYSEFPDIAETLLPEIDVTDLVTNRISVWLRKKSD